MYFNQNNDNNKFKSQSNIAFGKHIFDFEKNKPRTAHGFKRVKNINNSS